MANKLFEKIVGLNKFINPINAKDLDALHASTEIILKPDDAQMKQKISQNYLTFVKEITDDLIESTDIILDNAKKSKKESLQYMPNNELKTDHTMKKPQHAWINQIDNSYAPFVPLLKNKPHGLVAIP